MNAIWWNLLFPFNWKHIVFLDGLLHGESFSTLKQCFATVDSHFYHIKNFHERQLVWCFSPNVFLPVRFCKFVFIFMHSLTHSHFSVNDAVATFVCCTFPTAFSINAMWIATLHARHSIRCISTAIKQKNNVNTAWFQANHFKINIVSS